MALCADAAEAYSTIPAEKSKPRFAWAFRVLRPQPQPLDPIALALRVPGICGLGLGSSWARGSARLRQNVAAKDLMESPMPKLLAKRTLFFLNSLSFSLPSLSALFSSSTQTEKGHKRTPSRAATRPGLHGLGFQLQDEAPCAALDIPNPKVNSNEPPGLIIIKLSSRPDLCCTLALCHCLTVERSTVGSGHTIATHLQHMDSTNMTQTWL